MIKFRNPDTFAKVSRHDANSYDVVKASTKFKNEVVDMGSPVFTSKKAAQVYADKINKANDR